MGRPPSMTLEQFDPSLADQLVDQSLRSIAKGSNKTVLWRCTLDVRHFWPAKPYNRTSAKNPTGCGVCSGKFVITGVNDVATTHPEAAALMVDQGLATTMVAKSNKPVLLHCGDPNHNPWTAPLARVTHQGSGCPQCSGRVTVTGLDDLATTHPEIAAQLVDPSLATTLKAGSNRVVDWHCGDPRHPAWSIDPYARTGKGTGCPYCSGRLPVAGVNDLATTHPHLVVEMVDPRLASTIKAGHETDVEWRCLIDPRHGTWKAWPMNRTHAGSGCPVCANRTIIPGVNDLATTHPLIATQLLDPGQALTLSHGSGQRVSWQCPDDPGHVWEAPLHHRSKDRTATGCPRCRASLAEKELAALVRTLVPDTEDILLGDKSTGVELDISVPSRRLAIEFNGVHWHSEAAGRGKDYHLTKTTKTAQAGLQLVHVWEDDWWDRPEVVLRTLAHKMGLTHRLQLVLPDADPAIWKTLYARKLDVVEVTGSAAATFMEANHVQGRVTATLHLGLLDPTTQRLHAVLSLRSPRSNARMRRSEGQWEIQRYATLGSVPGGFTRLLKHAEQHLHPHGLTSWISFSAADVSDGGLYELTGFTVDGTLPPDYQYVGSSTSMRRVPKEQFQRRRFRDDPALVWDESWTERQAAAANRLHRVYDAGKTRWVKDV